MNEVMGLRNAASKLNAAPSKKRGKGSGKGEDLEEKRRKRREELRREEERQKEIDRSDSFCSQVVSQER